MATVIAVGIVAGVIVLLGWLVGGGAKHDTLRGQTVMRFGARFRGVGILGVLIGPLIVLLFGVRLLLGYDRPDIFIIPVSIAVFFVMLSTPLVLMAFRTEVRLDDTGITARRIFGGSTHIPWDSVDGITISSRAGGFFIEGAGTRLKVPLLLHGRDVFIEECKKRLTADRYGNAFDGPLPPLLL